MKKLKLTFILLFSLILNTVVLPSEISKAATNVIIDPSIQYQTMDGWGTSLSWWAMQVGGWAEEKRNDIVEKLFDPEEGIGLNIVRYNIGGGDDPDCVKPTPTPKYPGEDITVYDGHFRAEAKMTGYKDTEQSSYNWNNDANQRWVLSGAKEKGADLFEAFSCSPPYWMTVSGCSAGHDDGRSDNLDTDYYNDYAGYLADILYHFKNSWDLEFNTIIPLNESCTPPETEDWWWIAGGGYEGCHFNSTHQNDIIGELDTALAGQSLSTTISAPGEFSIQQSIDSYNGYNNTVKSDISTIESHTYYGTQAERWAMRDLAASENKKLWQSEVCKGGTVSHSHTDMNPALELTDAIFTDIKDMGVNGWVIWQAVENEYYNVNGDYNYGLIHGWYYGDDAQDYYIAKQYYAMGQLSKFIKKGNIIIDVNNSNVITAIDPGSNKLVIVVNNNSSSSIEYSFDLSGFTELNDTRATPFQTSSTQNMAQLSDITISNKSFTNTVPANSITTYIINGASYIGPVCKVINDNVKGTGNNQVEYNTTWGYYNAQSGAYSTDNHWSGTTNDYFKVRFDGNQIKVYGAKSYNMGKVAFSIDDGTETIVDCYSASRQEQQLLFTSPILSGDQHTLKGRVTGTKNASSSDYYVPLDKVVTIDADSTVPYAVSVNDNTTGTNNNQFEYNNTWSYLGSQNGPYAGDNHWSGGTNDYYKVRFYGTQINLYGSNDSNEGIAAVSIDDGTPVNVDCYSPIRRDQVLLYSSPVLTSGQHTLKVTVTGTKNSSSSNYYIPADKVDIIYSKTIVNDNTTGTGNNQFEYNTAWGYYDAQSGAYCNDNHWSGGTNDYYKVRFDGTQIKVFGSKSTNMGIAAISIDDGTETDVDCYSSTRQDNILLYTSPNLSSGQHTLKVRVKGTKNVSSSNYYIPADSVQIIK